MNRRIVLMKPGCSLFVNHACFDENHACFDESPLGELICGGDGREPIPKVKMVLFLKKSIILEIKILFGCVERSVNR
jgi:hypothetical protein